ncbi:MAG: HPr family phosphocarrier protein [Polyangiaceae bacterium UTPRO1]|jgi:phosphocarrier protein|nr:HPr family phosphocarrier protein [Myxococcales bacterium]OQY68583.1 MAG: HPr family phosphocarrier protein [Polyangiaceae bacterium UTPRO1]
MTLLGKERVDAETVRADVEIINRLGLHARAAARFVETASKFAAEVTVVNGDESVSGKSILGLMMLAAGQGTTLSLVATGADAEAAIDALAELIAQRFHESA